MIELFKKLFKKTPMSKKKTPMVERARAQYKTRVINNVEQFYIDSSWIDEAMLYLYMNELHTPTHESSNDSLYESDSGNSGFHHVTPQYDSAGCDSYDAGSSGCDSYDAGSSDCGGCSCD